MADKYDINFKILSERITPPFLRKPVLLAWFAALLKPVQELRDNIFSDYANGGFDFIVNNSVFGIRERVKRNAQTIAFENTLNREFAVLTAPLIYIRNFVGSQDLVYLTDETSGYTPSFWDQPPNTANETVFMGNEIDYLPDFDFIVYVPNGIFVTLGTTLAERKARVQSEVDKYKISGTTNDVLPY